MGSTLVVQILKGLLSINNLDVIFLVEAKIRRDKLEVVKKNLGFISMVADKAVGKSGGLLVLIKEGIIMSSSTQVYIISPFYLRIIR